MRAAVVLALAACSSPPEPPDAPSDGSIAALGPVQYAEGAIQSPLTPDLVEHLRAVHAMGTGSDAVFAKVGDSHTETPAYLGCFAGAQVMLDGRDLAATVAHFKAGNAAGSTPFGRTSLAAVIGWSAFQVLAGSPSPLAKEVAAIHPAFATVMFGTNDIGYARIDRYAQNLADISDTLLAQGIIPILSTIPPRDDDAAADLEVPRYNAIARGVAQTRGIPLVDLHRELLPLASHGLGGDHLHLESFSGGACQLTATGLAHGNNIRNLIVLQALDRLRRTLVTGEPAPDADAPRLAGAGSAEDPFAIAQLPFADRRDTTTFGADAITSYGTCGTQSEAGNEVYYRLDVAAAGMFHVYVADGAADIDLHVLRDTPTAATCLARGDTSVNVALTPGTYYVVADTFEHAAGDYTLVVMRD